MSTGTHMTMGEKVGATTAVIGLMVVMLGQFGLGIWWASGMANRVDQLERAQSTVTTLSLKVDDISGRLIKQETVADEIRRTTNRVDRKMNQLLKVPDPGPDDTP